MNEKLKNILKFIFVFVAFLGISRIILILLGYMGIDIANGKPEDMAYFQALIEVVAAFIIIMVYHQSLKEEYDNLKSRPKIVEDIIKLFVIFLVVKIASAVLTSVVAFMLGEEIGESENQNAIITIAKAAPLITLISTSVLAPFVEEGIFRLSLSKLYNNKFLFIIMSGLIFGLMHIFPTTLSVSVALIYSITYVTMGIYLAYVYVKYDNIWYCIMIHGLNNLLSILAIILMS